MHRSKTYWEQHLYVSVSQIIMLVYMFQLASSNILIFQMNCCWSTCFIQNFNYRYSMSFLYVPFQKDKIKILNCKSSSLSLSLSILCVCLGELLLNLTSVPVSPGTSGWYLTPQGNIPQTQITRFYIWFEPQLGHLYCTVLIAVLSEHLHYLC